MPNRNHLVRIGTGDTLRRNLEALDTLDLMTEYKYRIRRNPEGSNAWLRTAEGRASMIDAIVRYVDDTGDGPEQLKDMLRF